MSISNHISKNLLDACIDVYIHACIQPASQTDKPAGRQTDRLTDRQADRQTDRQADRQTDRQTKWVTPGGRVQRAAVLAFAGANSGDRLLGGPMGKHRGLFIHWSLVKSWYSYIIIIYHDLPNENGHKLGLHNPFPEYD